MLFFRYPAGFPPHRGSLFSALFALANFVLSGELRKTFGITISCVVGKTASETRKKETRKCAIFEAIRTVFLPYGIYQLINFVRSGEPTKSAISHKSTNQRPKGRCLTFGQGKLSLEKAKTTKIINHFASISEISGQFSSR